jgi:hypothetical protein
MENIRVGRIVDEELLSKIHKNTYNLIIRKQIILMGKRFER